MKGTEHFKRTIQMFLEQRAAEDELFAKSYRNPAKNIDDCVTYSKSYRTATRRQRKKKHKSNPHYLNFDYETEKQV